MPQHWTGELSGTRARQSELEWLSPDAERIRAVLGDGAVTWAVEVGQDIATTISRKVPALSDGVALRIHCGGRPPRPRCGP